MWKLKLRHLSWGFWTLCQFWPWGFWLPFNFGRGDFDYLAISRGDFDYPAWGFWLPCQFWGVGIFIVGILNVPHLKHVELQHCTLIYGRRTKQNVYGNMFDNSIKVTVHWMAITLIQQNWKKRFISVAKMSNLYPF